MYYKFSRTNFWNKFSKTQIIIDSKIPTPTIIKIIRTWPNAVGINWLFATWSKCGTNFFLSRLISPYSHIFIILKNKNTKFNVLLLITTKICNYPTSKLFFSLSFDAIPSAIGTSDIFLGIFIRGQTFLPKALKLSSFEKMANSLFELQTFFQPVLASSTWENLAWCWRFPS